MRLLHSGTRDRRRSVGGERRIRCAGQSLADVAKKEEERRKTVKAAGKVYTNKDLGALPPRRRRLRRAKPAEPAEPTRRRKPRSRPTRSRSRTRRTGAAA